MRANCLQAADSALQICMNAGLSGIASSCVDVFQQQRVSDIRTQKEAVVSKFAGLPRG